MPTRLPFAVQVTKKGKLQFTETFSTTPVLHSSHNPSTPPIPQRKIIAKSQSKMKPIFALLLLGTPKALAQHTQIHEADSIDKAQIQTHTQRYDASHLPTFLSRVHNPLPEHSKRDDAATPTTTDPTTTSTPIDLDSYEALAALESSLPAAATASSSPYLDGSDDGDDDDDDDDLPTSLPSN